jgi:hypothetical protein
MKSAPALEDAMAKQKLLAPPTLVQEAAAHDKELREQWGKMRKQARVVGGLFKEIRDRGLHKYVRKPGSKKGYQRFEEYVSDVTGGVANSTVWVMMRIHSLTEGPNPVPGHEVDEMPQQNAYELTKLEPKKRTVEIVQMAKRTPIKKFQAEIQEIKNATLPAEKRKPVLVEVYEKWPPQIVEMFEETVSDFCLLPVVRDGDRDIAIRHKAIAAILISARTHAADEIRAAKTELEAEATEIPDAREAASITVPVAVAHHQSRRVLRRSIVGAD